MKYVNFVIANFVILESILQNFFLLRFFFFGVKLGHFTINKCFSVCSKNTSLPAKNGEIFRWRRKKFVLDFGQLLFYLYIIRSFVATLVMDFKRPLETGFFFN